MHYSCDLGDGRQLHLDNDGGHTSVTLASGGESQRQSQGQGFDTGEWSEAPAAFRIQGEVVVRLNTAKGPQFLGVKGDAIRHLDQAPDVANAENLALKESPKPAGMKPMEPMKPMRPMEPMKPMRPMGGGN